MLLQNVMTSYFKFTIFLIWYKFKSLAIKMLVLDYLSLKNVVTFSYSNMLLDIYKTY